MKRFNTKGICSTSGKQQLGIPASQLLRTLLPFVFAALSGYCYLKPPALPEVPDSQIACWSKDQCLPYFFDSQPAQSSKPETVSETVYPVLSSLAPVISVGYGANPVQIRSFTPSTGVQIPLGTPLITRGYNKNLTRYPQGFSPGGLVLKKGCMKVRPFFVFHKQN